MKKLFSPNSAFPKKAMIVGVVLAVFAGMSYLGSSNDLDQSVTEYRVVTRLQYVDWWSLGRCYGNCGGFDCKESCTVMCMCDNVTTTCNKCECEEGGGTCNCLVPFCGMSCPRCE